MLTKIKSFFSRFFSWIWRHKRWVLITLLILGGLGFWGAKKFIKKKPDVSFTSDAEYTVSTGEVVQRLNLAGTTQFANSQKLNFIQEGKITAIFVKVGDNVKKDQVLATISSESLDREMETARNNLKRSREDLEKIQKENTESRVYDIKQAELVYETAVSNLKALPERQKIEAETLAQAIKEKKDNYDKKNNRWFGVGGEKSVEEKEKEARAREKKYLELIRDLRTSADKLANLLDRYDQLLHVTDKYEGEGNIYIGAKNVLSLTESKQGFRKLEENVRSLRDSYAKLSATTNVLDLSQNDILAAYDTHADIWENLQYWAKKNRSMFSDSIENVAENPRDTITMDTINAWVKEFSDDLLSDYSRTDAKDNAYDALRDLDDTVPAGTTKEEEIAKLKRELDQQMLDYESKLLSHKAETVKQEKEILDAKNSLEEIKNDGAKKKEIEALKNQIEDQQNALEKMRERYQNYQIVANFDGLVTKVDMQVGDSVGGSATAETMKTISVETPNLLQANLNIDQIDIVKVKVGMSVTVTVDALPGIEFTGHFSEIDTMSDGSSYKAKVVFQKHSDEEKILGGMYANVGVLINQLQDIMVVPNPAIADGAEGTKVVRFNKSGQRVDQVVEVGLADDMHTQILSGLQIGDRIKSLYITEESLTSAGIGKNDNAVQEIIL